MTDDIPRPHDLDAESTVAAVLVEAGQKSPAHPMQVQVRGLIERCNLSVETFVSPAHQAIYRWFISGPPCEAIEALAPTVPPDAVRELVRDRMPDGPYEVGMALARILGLQVARLVGPE